MSARTSVALAAVLCLLLTAACGSNEEGYSFFLSRESWRAD